MNNNSVYLSDEDEEIQYKLRDRVSDKRIEKRERQAKARKILKKEIHNEPKIRKDADARNVRAGRQREVSLLPEASNSERF